MKADEQTVFDLVRILRKRARPAALAGFAVLLAMTCFVFLLPAVYESKARLLIEQLVIPVELAGGLGSQEYVEQRLQRTRQLVLSDENIEATIRKYNVYDLSDSSQREYLIDYFKEQVFVTPQVTGVIDPRSMRAAELTYAFDVGFWHPDPNVATSVANELSDLFISSSSKRSKDDALRSIEFAKVESERLAEELRVREARLAKFRESNPGGLPEDRVRNQDRALSLERELAALDADLRASRGRRELLDAQLRDTPRDVAQFDESGQVTMGGAARLAVAQQELVTALAKYSNDHPDVRRLRREIDTLSADVGAGGSTARAPTNPSFVQLQTQVNAANIEVRELSARRHSVATQLAGLRGEITLSPRLEEQYRELVRDYEVIQTQYEQMRAQQATSELKAKAAGSSAGETYALINPARIPEQPVEPDRVALMFLAFVLAIAAGVGTAFLLNATDSTIRGSSDVEGLSGAPPFAHIPVMQSATVLRRQRLTDIALAAGITVVAIVVFMLVN